MKFRNANSAFKYLYKDIHNRGEDFGDTKARFNVGITILHPDDCCITESWRGWSRDYAEAEWQWYLSGDPSTAKLGEIYGKVPAIWNRMSDSDGNVRSNYGWQWNREHQIDKVIALLRNNPDTRQAAISIYDGKEINTYRKDTPCTYAVQFTIIEGKLCMSVYMRSNDLWFGFCNDQYCFSRLQRLVASELGLQLGWYYHHAHNMHIYNNFLNRNK